MAGTDTLAGDHCKHVNDALNDICLLVIENEKAIIPVTFPFFEVSQSSRKQRKKYCGSLVITRSGRIYKITGIDVIGLWGETMPQKVISALCGAYKIRVSFEESRTSDLEYIRSLLVECIEFDSKKYEPYLPQVKPLKILFEEIKKAKDVAQIYSLITIPSADDCLDVL